MDTHVPKAERARRRLLAVALLLTAIAVVALARAGQSGNQATSVHPLYAFDVRDDRKLAAAASDIFVGRVLAQTSNVPVATSDPRHVLPQSQFAVEVMQVIKGSAVGTITVNQFGGRRSAGVALAPGESLLSPGEVALFVTKLSPTRGWYSIVADHYGHHRIANAAERVALVARFAPATTQTTPPHQP